MKRTTKTQPAVKTDDKLPFEQIENEIIAFVNNEYKSNDSAGEVFKTKSDLLKFLMKFTYDILESKTSIFRSQWLKERFTKDELAEHGIFVEGEAQLDDFTNLDVIYLMGDCIARNYYLRNGCIEIFMIENAELNIDTSGNSYVSIQAYENCKLHGDISASSSLYAYLKGSVRSNFDINGHSKLELAQYETCRTEILATKLASADISAKDWSRLELHFKDLSSALIDANDHVTVIEEFGKNTNGIIKKPTEFAGKHYTIKERAVKPLPLQQE